MLSFKHCIQRISKACQIQLSDFQWKNGPYRESSFASAEEQTLHNAVHTNSDRKNNEDLLKQRLELLKDLIEIE